jgi:stage II sporulation protein D
MLGISSRTEAAPRNIKVGLAVNRSNLKISSTSSYLLTDSKGKTLPIKGTLTLSGNGATGITKINGKSFHLPLTLSTKGLLIFDKRKYRGKMQIIRGRTGLTLINTLGVEDYLRGVLKMEVNPSWPMESLKTQAIISRTYAYRHFGRHGKEGFDVCALPHCQVYRGVNAEDKTLDRAIRETAGLVVTYNGKLALTPFHSDSGGATADVQTVWGGNVPYLNAKKEPRNYVSPYSSWKVSLDLSRIQSALKRKGISLGTVTGIDIEKQDPFGRVNSIRITGTSGSKVITGHSFRMMIGSKTIKSTMFQIPTSIGNSGSAKTGIKESFNSTSPAPRLSFVDEGSSKLSLEEERLITVLTKQGFFTADQMIDMLVHPEKRKSYLVKALNRKPVKTLPAVNINKKSNNSHITLVGKGWGHGVGLSQWGAKSLAESGWTTRKIISHYYPGTRITKYY